MAVTQETVRLHLLRYPRSLAPSAALIARTMGCSLEELEPVLAELVVADDVEETRGPVGPSSFCYRLTEEGRAKAG